MQKRSIAYTLALSAMIVGGLGSAAMADRARDHHPGGMMGPGGKGLAFDEIDVNKDGTITAEEFQAWRAGRIEGLDANGDGKIDAAEIVAQEMKRAEVRAQKKAADMIARLDVDGDGAISAAELLVGPGPGPDVFARFDTDGDGSVTKAEIDAARKAHAERGDRDGRGPGDRPGRGPGRDHGGDRGGDRGGEHRPGKPGPDGAPRPDAPPAQ